MKTPVNSISSGDYENLLHRLSNTYLQGRQHAVQAVNSHLIETYWQIGQYIVEFEQAGEARAIYGKALLEALARDLTLRHGKGFSRSNLNRFRQFYTVYPICAKASHKLSWSHYVERKKLEDDLERGSTRSKPFTNGGLYLSRNDKNRHPFFCVLLQAKTKQAFCSSLSKVNLRPSLVTCYANLIFLNF